MSRNALILTVLGFILVGVAFFFLLFQPKQTEIAEIEAQIATVQTQQQQARTTIATRQELRAMAPQIEAAIGSVDAIVPSTPAIPSALRQLQLAADESGVELLTISPGRPVGPGLQPMAVSLTMQGGYFQIIDFLRRIEDPTITPRAILWDTIALAPAEYPTLTGSVSGQMYSLISEAGA